MALTTALREALNEGISSGSFVDTKIILYSHRDSSGRACKPKALYANSHILKTVPYFDDRECTTTFRRFEVLFGDFAEAQSKDFKEAIDEEEYAEDYGYSSDSDLEDDEDKDAICSRGPEVTIGGDKIATKAEDYKEQVEKGKVVKIPDIAFLTWKSLFFYLCTGAISFAPLKSQGIVSRSDHIRQKTIAAAPPPCSPKSIYLLANLLGIQPLCTIAFADIKSKVTLGNVVDEIFSRVTAGQKEIMEMEWDLLIPNLKDPETFALVKENVGLISSGSSSHCADTLKLGLKKVIELEKEKRESPGVNLRCSNSFCSWRGNLPSVFYCQACFNMRRGTHYLQCAGCGYVRTGYCTSCQGCGKKFI
ncbi:hypothetical protein BJ322DRAFT_1006423 [Thelephora terrestris]|uniref:Uncharacterized protein n=1 Tax=Thelephora terrestris TaxID=56493 RepID=A0A9P6HHE7_9AGAM|nr:hypothetical protein BJ322DRAFT_1006423 [Thelephora terrestris]